MNSRHPGTGSFRFGVATVAALGLAAAVGCSSGSNAASTPVAAAATPEVRLTPQVAAAAFRSFTSNDDIGRSAADERLSLSWVVDGQSMLTAAAFRKAAFQEEPTPRFSYGKPKLYVPRITNYPQWFLAVAERTDITGEPIEPAAAGNPPKKKPEEPKASDKRTALMVFTRKDPSGRWRLALSSLLDKGGKLPHFTVDQQGYAKPLATFAGELMIQPRFIGAMQATLAEEGRESLAADVMEIGKHTADHYEKIQDKKKDMKEDGFAYDSIFAATQFPVYGLRTTDGGGFVLYSMSRDTVVFRKSDKVDRIPIPRPAAHLLSALIMHDEMGVTEMHQYAATVPLKSKSKGKPGAPKTKIIGFDGEPVKATGT